MSVITLAPWLLMPLKLLLEKLIKSLAARLLMLLMPPAILLNPFSKFQLLAMIFRKKKWMN